MARLRSPGAASVRETIGHYRLLEPLGGGGMGILWTARDTRLDRTVVLKFLPPHLLANESAARRFLFEAQAAAALDHPNICTIHEVGEAPDGRSYIAMPFYDGETLRARIARAPIAIDDAIAIAIQIARGLAKAHDHAIIHRDIKPANVMLTADGVAKILDFGVAKLTDVTLTTGGAAVGTVAYMSPEQGRGEAVDHRTDVWSLGVVIYEMVTARRPFAGEHAGAVLSAILGREPEPIATLRPDVPPELDALVMRALRKDRDGRYATAGEMARELAALRGTPDERPLRVEAGSLVPGGARRRPVTWRTRPALAIALVVLAGGAGATWLVARGATEVPPAVAVLPFADLSPEGNQEYLGDGITEELINALGQMAGLHVVSRTYERDVEDIFTIQEEIALSVVETLKGTHLARADSAALSRPQPDVEAYNLYLRGRHALYIKGRYSWYRRTEEALRSAATYFAQAIERDSGYALAHAGLADAYAVLGFYDYLPPLEAFPGAERAAQRALAIDSSLAQSYATLGYVDLYHHWNWTRAESWFQRAIVKDARYATAHQWYANLLTARARFDEAEHSMRRAQERSIRSR
ncbi:MAG: protein kinase [Gemmatimonadota bacterium]|nr:protein kinase [Gemmatimonadota bacterium]